MLNDRKYQLMLIRQKTLKNVQLNRKNERLNE